MRRETADRYLAAVIVACNEEVHVAACIEATLQVGVDHQDYQVVLVDSRSTDRTIEIATRYPIDVVRIRNSRRCTAALGRAIGQHLTRSRYLVFIDGDTEISRAWVQAALEFMETHPQVGGVGGKLREIYYRAGVPIGEAPDFFGMGEVAEDAYQLGGNAIYRRRALDEVGSFNPGVVSHEEAELAERMRRAGHRLVRIPLTLGTHHTAPRDGWGEPWRRFRAGLLTGYGQVLRTSIGTPMLHTHARHLNRYLAGLAFILAGVIGVAATLISGRPAYLASWLLLAVSLLGALVVRARDMRRALTAAAEWALAAPAIVVGFVRGPLPGGIGDLDEMIERC